MATLTMSNYAWEFKIVPASGRGMYWKVLYRRQEHHRKLGDKWHQLLPINKRVRYTQEQAWQALCDHFNNTRTSRRGLL